MAKLLNQKFRIVLITFGLGLASVFIWQGFSRSWRAIPIDLAKTRSGQVIEVTVSQKDKVAVGRYSCDEFSEGIERETCLKQVIFQDRDVSLYDDGGQLGCSREQRIAISSKCERSMQKARQFVWDHWKRRKRGFVAVAKGSEKTEWVHNLFIEPTADGSWRIAVRTIPMRREPEDLELGDLIEIEWYRATAEDEYHGLTSGILYLKLNNITGDSLLL